MSKKFFFAVLSIIIVLILILIPFTYELAYRHHIYPGVKIKGVDIGNLTRISAKEKLVAAIKQDIPAQITLTDDQKNWLVDVSPLQVTFNFDEVIEKAYQVGRQGSLKEKLTEKFSSWRGKINFSLNASFRQDLLDEEIDQISQEVSVEGVPVSANFQNGQIIINQGREGQLLDERRLKQLIIAQITNLKSVSILLPLKAVYSHPSPEEIEQLRHWAVQLIDKKLVLKNDGKTILLSNEALISLIHYNEVEFEERIKKKVAQIAVQINLPPQNALFEFKNDHLAVFRQAREGRRLDSSQAVALIKEGLKKLTVPSNEKELIITLPVITVIPEITNQSANNLGINTRLGRGISYFRGSSKNRMANINLAASRLNGVLIAPEETFSFNEALGEVSAETGYRQAYIIKEGKTILGAGGGVCQTSTTFFRVALNTGLPILERQAHAYRVYYYEQESKLGLDATVYSPRPDLKIKNDTPAYLLLQTQFFPKEHKLIFDFYGTDDSRQVKISNFKIWDIAPPPPPLYIDTPDLPKGEIKQTEHVSSGAKARFDWQVVRQGEILHQKTFYSSYRPWQAVYLRGTKE